MKIITKQTSTKLEQLLKEKYGVGLKVTGKEIIDLMNLTYEDIERQYYLDYNYIDSYGIEMKTKYINDLKDNIVFHDEVLWYEKDSDADYKYVTIGIKEKYMSYETISSIIISFPDLDKERDTDVLKIIELLQKVIKEDDQIRLSYNGRYFEAMYEITKSNCIVKYYDEFINVDNEAEEMDIVTLLYLLITISYETPLIDTMNLFLK